MIEMLFEVFKHAIMITGFVFVMMLVIEYVNVQTRGVWQNFINSSPWSQYILAAALGAVPGCLGSFTVVTMFSHGIISLGAVVTAMIATSGDETFVMLAMIPSNALLIIALTFIIGIFAGIYTDKLFPKLSHINKFGELPIHKEEKCQCFSPGKLFQYLKKPTVQRVLLIIFISLLLVAISLGYIAEDMKGWMITTIIIVSIISLFIVITVPEHFLKEHLWNHIVKIHIPRIFLWTFGALLLIHLLMQYIDVNSWVQNNLYMVLLVALLIGLIPESGPHLVFVTLFASGTIPFSILLANSIVQDGHGMIPMLAESKRGFIIVKLINLAVGAVIGFIALSAGF
ncbi:MAG: putative manganese transporter [Candidatus Stygibacter frigidus]|nr:putative manganese transporter [Candidatus Stygibacter frigidus]